MADQAQVIEFIHQSNHPLKEVMEAAREIVLSANQDILEWVSNDRATVKLYSLQDVDAKSDRLRKVVNQWVTLTEEN